MPDVEEWPLTTRAGSLVPEEGDLPDTITWVTHVHNAGMSGAGAALVADALERDPSCGRTFMGVLKSPVPAQVGHRTDEDQFPGQCRRAARLIVRAGCLFGIALQDPPGGLSFGDIVDNVLTVRVGSGRNPFGTDEELDASIAAISTLLGLAPEE